MYRQVTHYRGMLSRRVLNSRPAAKYIVDAVTGEPYPYQGIAWWKTRDTTTDSQRGRHVQQTDKGSTPSTE